MENQKNKENQQRFELKPAPIYRNYREQKAHSPFKSKFLAADG
jgi:hypothetical protein